MNRTDFLEYKPLNVERPATKQPQRRSKMTKKFALTAVLALGVLAALYYRPTTPKSFLGARISLDQIPRFRLFPHLNPAANVAEATVYKAHYVSRMLGSEATSDFSNVVKVWRNHLMYLKTWMEPKDIKIAGSIYNLMLAYENMKEKRSSRDSAESSMFWTRFMTLLDFENGDILTDEGNPDQKVTGAQLKYWRKLEWGLNFYNTPRWVTPQGKIQKGSFMKHNLLPQKTIPYSGEQKDFYIGAWGPEPRKDDKGNERYDKHHFAAQFFNDKPKNGQDIVVNLPREDAARVSERRRMTHKAANRKNHKIWWLFGGKKDDTPKGIPISIPREDDPSSEKLKIALRKNYGLRFLGIFESVRLGNKLTSEDHLFCRGAEKVIGHWAVEGDDYFKNVKKHFGVFDFFGGLVTGNAVKTYVDRAKGKDGKGGVNAAQQFWNQMTAEQKSNNAGSTNPHTMDPAHDVTETVADLPAPTTELKSGGSAGTTAHTRHLRGIEKELNNFDIFAFSRYLDGESSPAFKVLDGATKLYQKKNNDCEAAEQCRAKYQELADMIWE